MAPLGPLFEIVALSFGVVQAKSTIQAAKDLLAKDDLCCTWPVTAALEYLGSFMSIRPKKGYSSPNSFEQSSMELLQSTSSTTTTRATPIPHPHDDAPPGLHHHAHHHDGECSHSNDMDVEEGASLIKVRERLEPRYTYHSSRTRI